MSRVSGIVYIIGELNVVFRSTLCEVVFVECCSKRLSGPFIIILIGGMIICIRTQKE
jgi:hypothetical protein